ncbi:hypothetical protein PF008_g8235 [Phytophthora fragariae]|uniref:Integrase zinc-binding domain-containing protein n=1 Tax=Phytophthora fragariae TaxID=53985 RepID=A0A6G0S1S0_9STRA|nr:hypothetical protein PF008_g8235 [Phytophthora fragariae]
MPRKSCMMSLSLHVDFLPPTLVLLLKSCQQCKKSKASLTKLKSSRDSIGVPTHFP